MKVLKKSLTEDRLAKANVAKDFFVKECSWYIPHNCSFSKEERYFLANINGGAIFFIGNTWLLNWMDFIILKYINDNEIELPAGIHEAIIRGTSSPEYYEQVVGAGYSHIYDCI